VTVPDAPEREGGERSDAARAADCESAAVRAIVLAVRGGDRDAFAQLVARYQRRLFGLALMLTREPSAAEDMAQDAFVRAFTRLDAYDERRPFYPWLATIAVRLAQNWLSRRARLALHEADTLASDRDAPIDTDSLATLIADERGRRLWRLVAALPSGERTAAILYYRQDMSVGDIARALGVTSGTVKTLLFRARQRLRRTAGEASLGKDDL
jgi:RNA polymerase sigma-70 factor, ECF subfamily